MGEISKGKLRNGLKQALYEHGAEHDARYDYAEKSVQEKQENKSLYSRYSDVERELFANELSFAQLPDYPDHGIKHTTSVQNISADLVPDKMPVPLTAYEIFLLLVSALFHDIGMLVTKRSGETSREIRLDHCNRSKEFLLKNYSRFGLKKHEAEIVGRICISHGLPDLNFIENEVYSLKGHREIRVSLICAILRLADALDVTADRAPEGVSTNRKMSYENKQHWDLLQCVSDVNITTIPSWDIVIFALPSEESLEPALFRLKGSIQKELDTTSNILRSAGIYFKKIDLKLMKDFSKTYEKKVKNPFVLLDWYDRHNAFFFSGRDEETQQMLEMICSRNLVLLIGESGVGKTSLVRAGICPKLKLYKREEKYEIVKFEFQGDPIESLISALEKDKNKTTRSKDLFTAIENKILRKRHVGAQKNKGLRRKIPENEREGKVVKEYKKMLIIGDHLEKMFTLNESDEVRINFLHQLSRVLGSGMSVSFLFCIREDYLADLHSLSQDISEFYKKNNTFRLHRLDQLKGRKVLEKASEYSRVKLSNDLIERVVRDLCYEGDGLIFPPFLQIVGHRLYQAQKQKISFGDNEITEEDYESLGGVEQIVNQYLESLLDQFKLEDKRVVGKILKAMVTDYYTKKRVTEKELKLALPDCSNIKNFLLKLVNKRIVRRSHGSYELIHDFLARRIIETIDQRRYLSKPVRKAIKFIEENYHDKELRSADVAKAAGVTQMHLSVLFSEQLNFTINKEINSVRVANAKKIMDSSLDSLSDIALRVGFKCQGSFSRKFRELEKIPPLQYRKIVTKQKNSRRTMSRSEVPL